MNTAKKKTTIPDGLTINKSGKKNKRWRIYESALKIGASTEGYINLQDLEANLKSIHRATTPAAIQKAIDAFKNRTK